MSLITLANLYERKIISIQFNGLILINFHERKIAQIQFIFCSENQLFSK